MNNLFKTTLLILLLLSTANADELVSTDAVFAVPPADQLHSMGVASQYVGACTRQGVDRTLCTDMLQPFRNPPEMRAFQRIYGEGTDHMLIPPREVWGYGLELIKLAQEAATEAGVAICQIRNWYRPEPYNSSEEVGGGSNSQHITAQAIDIDFCGSAERNRALEVLRAKRAQTGKPAGIGTYVGGHTIHIDYLNRTYHKNPN